MNLEKAAKHWDNLAQTELENEVYERKFGSTRSFLVRADIYKRTAEALRIQMRTGVPVCSCHHIPYEECAKLGRSR